MALVRKNIVPSVLSTSVTLKKIRKEMGLIKHEAKQLSKKAILEMEEEMRAERRK